MKSSVVILTLVLLTLSIGTIGTVNAEPIEVPPPSYSVDATSNASNIKDLGMGILNTIVDIILAPFKAIATVFTSWGGAIGSTWYAPLIAVFVIIIIVLMIRLYSETDRFFDLFS